MKYGTLAHRIAQEWDPEQAITREVEQRERVYSRPARMIEAFGETKSVADWQADPRVVVVPNVFLRRIQHGWSTESSLTSPISSARGKREGNAMKYTAFDEEKTLREWAQDERCQVSEMTLRKNLQAGMPMEDAFLYRRKPGRHFVGAHEDFTGEVNELKAALDMLVEGGELWVYDSVDMNRISLIHKDVRHTISKDLFQVMLEQNLIRKSFETDTIKNFELTSEGQTAAV